MNILNWLSQVGLFLPKLGLIVLSVAIVYVFVAMVLRLVRYIQLLRVHYVCLEVTPPARTQRDQKMTSQLFTALHGIGMTHGVLSSRVKAPVYFFPEIDSTRAGGIRYLLRVPENQLSSVERLIHAYLSDVKITQHIEPEVKEPRISKILSYRQKKHYAFPLRTADELDEKDPVSYLTAALANPTENEHFTVQLLIHPIVDKESSSLSYKILENEDLLHHLERRRFNMTGVFTVINKFLFGILDLFGSLFAPERNHQAYNSAYRDLEYKKQVAKHLRPVRTLSYFEHELVESIHQKLSEPLFETEIRVKVGGSSKKEVRERIKNIHSALMLHSVPKYQQLVQNKSSDQLLRKLLQKRFDKCLPSMRRQSVFSALELANLYHFPGLTFNRTDNVMTSLSKTLAAPVALKGSNELAIVLGENVHHGITTPIGLMSAERERHVYIIGGTGNGKTTMLLYSIVQDMSQGNGVAVLDPHGDLAETVLGYVPKERLKDVVYINPDDLAYPVGINLLELTPGLSGDDLLREKDLITESTISVLRKIFSEDDSGGHRIEYVLRNTIQTALTLEGATLFTIFRLINDTKFRQKVVRELEDDDLKIFWRNEIAKAGEMQKVKMAAGITSKVGRFLFSASARRILEQEKSTINFEEILANKKILICNFSKGLVGEDASTLFGTTVLAKLQVAALRRARIKQVNRQPYYLYVDEFQNFATMSFVQMLSEARKYKLFLTMAEQSTQQQQYQRLVDVILANVGTVVCFRSGSPADERFVLPLFKPYLEEGEISNLPAYSFYMRIAAVEAHEPLSGTTLLISTEPDEAMQTSVINMSRKTYGRAVKKTKTKQKQSTKTVSPETKDRKEPDSTKPSTADQFAVAKQ